MGARFVTRILYQTVSTLVFLFAKEDVFREIIFHLSKHIMLLSQAIYIHFGSEVNFFLANKFLKSKR